MCDVPMYKYHNHYMFLHCAIRLEGSRFAGSDANERSSSDFEALAVNGAPECARCGAEDGNYTFDRTTKRLICSSCAPHRFPRAPTPTSDRWTSKPWQLKEPLNAHTVALKMVTIPSTAQQND